MCSLLIDYNVDSTKICYTTPVNVEHNCTFIIDQSKLANPDDIHADDCGSWKNNGSRPSIITWNRKNADIVAHGASSCKKYVMKSSDYHLVRTYFIHKSYQDFRKVISIIYGMC